MNESVKELVAKPFPIPTVAEERAAELHRSAGAWRRHRLITLAERDAIRQSVVDPWRHYGLAVSVVFFSLTALGVTALFGLCELLHFPKGAITAILSIGAAELLIRRARFFGTGIESGLWLGGLLAIIFDLPSSGRPEALLVFAPAFGIAGLRVRNALMGTAAVILVVAYAAVKTHSEWPPLLVGISVAIAAAMALQRVWQRPSSEHWFAALTMVMPATGYVAGYVSGAALQRVVALDSSWAITAVLLMAALLLLAMSIRSRDRILLIAASLVTGLLIFENRNRFPWPVEAKCIAAGLVLAAIGVAISRFLAARTNGFVVTAVEAGSYEELAQMGGAVLVVAHPAHAGSQSDAEPTGGGGGFGGGGASGDY